MSSSSAASPRTPCSSGSPRAARSSAWLLRTASSGGGTALRATRGCNCSRSTACKCLLVHSFQFSEWIDLVDEIMQSYVETTEGSKVTRRDSCISWDFQHAEREFGLLQAKELKFCLQAVLREQPIEVKESFSSVKVVPALFNDVSLSFTHIHIDRRNSPGVCWSQRSTTMATCPVGPSCWTSSSTLAASKNAKPASST